MIRKALSTILFAMAALLGFAQGESWYRYPIYTDSVTDVIEASNKVYYLSGANLFSFSPEDQESYSYSSLNKLTDTGIQSIYYNAQAKYLLIAYKSGNIDVLYDNGKLVNLPEIRDAQFTAAKTINHVAFGEGRIAVAASFGIVVYDEGKMEVIESGIYNANIELVAIMGGRLLIYHRGADGFMVSQSPLNERHNTMDKFKPVGPIYLSDMMPLSDTTLLMRGKTSGKLQTREVNFAASTWSGATQYDYVAAQPMRPCKDGYYTATAEEIVIANGEGLKSIALPKLLQGQKIAINANSQQVWAGDPDGIACIDISQPAPAVLYDKMLPADALTCTKVGFLTWSPDGERLYVSNLESSVYKSVSIAECSDAYQTTNIIENGHVSDVSLKNASADHSMSQKWQTLHSNKRMYGDASWILEDPDDPDIYYCANNHEGVYVVKYNQQSGEYEEIGKFDVNNTPVPENWGARVQAMAIDPQGNLWIGYRSGARLAVLPAAKRRQDPSTITRSDWKEHPRTGAFEIDQKDMMLIFCKKSNMAFFFSGKHEGGLIAIDTKGTYDNPNDDVVMHWTQFTDQDGNNVPAPTRVTFAIEDERGCVWIGTSSGVFEITVPGNAVSSNMTIRRIKVPRNDGTNYADYLLDSDQINWIATDPSDRKWIATETSGIFLVSQNGDQILRNYHCDNSPLLSNITLSIECDKHDNTVYVGTADGLYTFLSDSAPASEDYSELFAYPNPVRPEFYGDVTITGLMDNSVVKIADASGHVVYQTRSQGGMATWNVCDGSGNRVKSGVYFVYATSNNGSSAGAVTKIMVIN